MDAIEALSGLVAALRNRHYGRMPEELQRAFDCAVEVVEADARAKAEAVKCCVCGTRENLHYEGWFTGYRCNSDDCVPI